jgi:hypothetical protein
MNAKPRSRLSLSAALARPGFTFLELIVVLFIAVVVISLFVVLIQKMRERSNRVLCENNLREIGKAISLFEGRQRYLPPSRIADGYATWAVLIAPDLAKTSLLEQWDLEKPYFEQPQAARQAQFRYYYCPARRDPPQNSVSGDVAGQGTPNVPGALCDYACAAGTDGPKHPWMTERADGPFVVGKVIARDGERITEWEPRIRKKDLRRGLSHTVLIGEKHVPLGSFGEAQAGDGSAYNGANPASFARVAGPGFGLAPSATAPLNRNFGSYHVGVCQFLMADVHVEAMAVSVSETLLGELVRRED